MAKAKKTGTRRAGERGPFDMTEEERGRMVVWIPYDGFHKDKGWRVSYVFEKIAGHYPTGSTPEGGDVEPWFWGMNRDEAQAAADDYNLQRFNIDAKEAAIIVMRSIASGMRGKRAVLKRA